MDHFLEDLQRLEKNFKVKYPDNNSATYKSLVNYANDLNKPIQRWYRYKEGYSVELMQQIFDIFKIRKNDIILDPFCGSGSTNVQAKTNGCHSIGYEVNPFSAFLAKVKTQNYSKKDKELISKIVDDLIANIEKCKPAQKPKLSTIDKLFEKDILNFLLKGKTYIDKQKGKVKDILFFAWLSILEESSNYRKDGNGLKIKKSKKNDSNKILKVVQKNLVNALIRILEDFDLVIELSKKVDKEPEIYNKTSLTLKEIRNSTLKGVVFSPPYANCFDYTEIYKIELWMGGFVDDYPDLKKLRKVAVRSHLNGYSTWRDLCDTELDELNKIISDLQKRDLWDKRIPKMVQAYFEDMFEAIKNHYRALKKGGFDVIVVSNSAYAGQIIPTDLLLARYAKKIGFKVKEIDVARYIITSSQQYEKTRKYKKYLRESIIYLQK